MTAHDYVPSAEADRTYAEARRLVWCGTCRTDVEGGRILVDQYGGIAATYCDAPVCRAEGYARARMELGTAAGCREVTP
jgi:hypothetical protein